MALQRLNREDRQIELKKRFIKHVIDNINMIKSKDKCYNLFQDLKIYEYKMFNPKLTANFVQYKR